MKNLKSKAVFASLLFAGLSLVSCKDRNSETEGGDTTGTETGSGYDETQGNTGETGNENMSPGADGQTGTVNDTTSVNNSGSTGTGSGNAGNGGTGTGGSGTGNGTTHP